MAAHDLTVAIPERPPSVSRERVTQWLTRITAEPTVGQAHKTVTTFAPYTGSPIADVPQSSVEDVAAAFGRARAAQVEWARRPISDRTGIFLKFHDLVLRRQNEIMDLIQWETGKARKYAFAEMLAPVVAARYYARRARGFLKPRRATVTFPGATRAWEYRHPRGVIGMISPFNYPFELGVADAIPALIAGNGVVSKPDTQTALSVLWAHELLEEAGLPRRLWQIVVGDGPVVGPAVVDHADYVSFTGSTRTGREVGQRAGGRLIGASLELGGKNAMIVLRDANLNRTAIGAVDACFASSGQVCVSVERIYVHESVYDKFMAKFAARTKALHLAPTYDYTADVGALTTRAQLDKVIAHVEEAKAKGASVVTGGNARPDLGPQFFEPTILTGVTNDMTVCHEETFGPVVAVYQYRDLNEVIERVNQSPYGLNASIWTRDRHNARWIATRLHTGTVNINDGFVAAYGSIGAPMGGMKESGLSRRHGLEGIMRFTESQTVASQRLFVGVEPPLRMSFNRWRKLVTTSLLVAKRIGMR